MIAHVGTPRCLQPDFAVQPLDVQPVSGPLRELLQVLDLCSPVTVAKRVNMVDIANNPPRSVREVLGISTAEILRRCDTAMNIRHAGLDETHRLKPAARFAYFDGSDLARPFIDILEQVAVYGLQVGEVEITRWHSLVKPQSHMMPFYDLQRPGIPDVQLVAKNRKIRRIAIVPIAHSATVLRLRSSSFRTT